MPPMTSQPQQMFESTPPPEPFYLLLYRYFFCHWLYRDVNRGTYLERAAAMRFNQERRGYLPTYLWRWLVLLMVTYWLGVLFERGLAMNYVATFFFCGTLMSVVMLFLVASAWLGLKYL